MYVFLIGLERCKAGWLQMHRDLPVSASQVLELKVYDTIPGPKFLFKARGVHHLPRKGREQSAKAVGTGGVLEAGPHAVQPLCCGLSF